MDRNDLVELVLARVAAKLAEAEHSAPVCSTPPPDDGRPGLLILTQEHGDTCHPVLEDARLREKFRQECALLHAYQVEPDRFDVVVLFGLSNDALCQLACRVCTTPYAKLAQTAILTGKRVLVPAEQVEALRPDGRMPAPYAAMLREKLGFLVACGLKICPQEGLIPTILEEDTPCSLPKTPQPAAVPAEEKEFRLEKRVITERDVSAAAADKVTLIHISERCILTALASEYARSKDIRLVRDL